MAKIIFEADDNRKGIVDKIFVINKQIVQKGDKIANIVTQNKVYEIKAPVIGEVQNLIIYENKVINSGDPLLDLVSFGPTLGEQPGGSDQTYNTISFNGTGKYNGHNKAPIDIKKSETEIFREELIETLLAREVAGENPQDDFNDTGEINDLNTTNSTLLKDKVVDVIENIPRESDIETLQKDLGDLKEDLVIVKEDLATMTIHEEIIEDIENLERDLSSTINDEKGESGLHYVENNKQETGTQTSNEKKFILDAEITVPLPEFEPEEIMQDNETATGEDNNENCNAEEELKKQSTAKPEKQIDVQKEHDKDVKIVKFDDEDVPTDPTVVIPEPLPVEKSNGEAKKVEKPPVDVKPVVPQPLPAPLPLEKPQDENKKPKKLPEETKTKAATVDLLAPTSLEKEHDEKNVKPKKHLEHSTTHKKDYNEQGKAKKHLEHSKTHATVHSSASHGKKQHDDEEIKQKPHSNLGKHKAKADPQKQEFDEIKLKQQQIERAKEILTRKNNVVHSFIDVEVDISELVSLLAIIRETYLQNNIELTLLPFYVKAVYNGLKKFPILNASFNSKDYVVLLKWFYNIAFSVDSDTSVKMPVLYNLKNSSIKDIALNITKLIDKATNDELEAGDYQNSSFSIINYSEYGITRGTFTFPEEHVAGIAMGIIFKKPVVVEKNDIAIRDIMVITLGYNEAVIDITEASKFVHYVAYLLSNPGLFL